jgi:hypothetical protein
MVFDPHRPGSIFRPGGRSRWTPIPGKLRWHYQFVLDRAIGTSPYVRHPDGKFLEFIIY